MPAFTQLCIGLGPGLLLGLAIAAGGYCVWVWTRKGDNRSSWVGFLATAGAALGLLMLPTIVAIYLPLADALNRLASK
jgi:drug/metabolite transporter superfamily protein YnfA